MLPELTQKSEKKCKQKISSINNKLDIIINVLCIKSSCYKSTLKSTVIVDILLYFVNLEELINLRNHIEAKKC